MECTVCSVAVHGKIRHSEQVSTDKISKTRKNLIQEDEQPTEIAKL